MNLENIMIHIPKRNNWYGGIKQVKEYEKWPYPLYTKRMIAKHKLLPKWKEYDIMRHAFIKYMGELDISPYDTLSNGS